MCVCVRVIFWPTRQLTNLQSDGYFHVDNILLWETNQVPIHPLFLVDILGDPTGADRYFPAVPNNSESF